MMIVHEREIGSSSSSTGEKLFGARTDTLCKELMGSEKKPDPFLVLLLHFVCLPVPFGQARTDCMFRVSEGDHYKLDPSQLC